MPGTNKESGSHAAHVADGAVIGGVGKPVTTDGAAPTKVGKPVTTDGAKVGTPGAGAPLNVGNGDAVVGGRR